MLVMDDNGHEISRLYHYHSLVYTTPDYGITYPCFVYVCVYISLHGYVEIIGYII